MFYCLLASIVSNEKSICIHVYVYRCIWFCIATFSMFSLFFGFQWFGYYVSGHVFVWLFVCLSCLGLAEFPASVNFYSSPNLGSFQLLFLQNSPLLLGHQWLFHIVPEVPSTPFFCLFVCLFFISVPLLGKFLFLYLQVLLRSSSEKNFVKHFRCFTSQF